jgi:hypothetical protein
MKRILYFLSLITVLSLALSACEGATPTPTPPTAAPVTEPTATPPPATEPPVTEAPVLEPIDLAGPPMEVGSRYRYLDAIIVAVPGGPFIMGSKYFGDTERTVNVDDFWIYSTKITNGQYTRCVESGDCTLPNLENNPAYNVPREINLPVTGVNYAQGEAYCKYVHARYPTEAEWEKTARGPDGNLFPWGDSAPVCNLLNFNFCKGKPTDVTDYPPGASYYSALDMSGNAREWVADWFSAKYYDEAPAENPLGPELGVKRSVRGSSYQDSGDPSLSAHRFSLKPSENLPDLGFRCVVEDPTYYAPYCQSLALLGANPNGGPSDQVITLPAGCDQPGITADCGDKKTQINIVPFPSGVQVVVNGSCDPNTPNESHYSCSGTGTISVIPQTCSAPDQGNTADCGPGDYVLDSSTGFCVGKGPGVNCPTGFDYAPAAQCCMAKNPGAQSHCPPGFLENPNACTPDNPNSPDQPNPVGLKFDNSICQPSTGDTGNPDGCVPKSCVTLPNRAPDPNCVEVTCPSP